VFASLGHGDRAEAEHDRVEDHDAVEPIAAPRPVSPTERHLRPTKLVTWADLEILAETTADIGPQVRAELTRMLGGRIEVAPSPKRKRRRLLRRAA
jgi:hypothetical protein